MPIVSYLFDDFEFSPTEYHLSLRGEPVEIQPQTADALGLFVRQPGELVSRKALMEAIWPGVYVTENSIDQLIRKLRKCLGDRPRSPRCLETVPGRGYRFIAAVEQVTTVVTSSVEAPRDNLPVRLDRFVGRVDELAALEALLDAGHRLVTLAGSGGTGKTRLAQCFGSRQREHFPGGVWFCDLSNARGLPGILTSVATALDVSPTEGEALAQLGSALLGRGRTLLILDNAEQVAASVAQVAVAWVARAPEAVLLVTSRERLAVAGEQVHALDPLPEADAVLLFEDRAASVRSSFRVTDSNRAAVRGIVRQLDGVPLALELAAARAHILAPEVILARLTDRFTLLRSRERGRPSRQATLRGAIDWSWNLLAHWEQLAMVQISTFVGTFTLEAAEAVLELSAWPGAPPALDAVHALVDKSLVRLDETDGGTRFDMDASIRAYAAEKFKDEEAIPSHDGGWCTGAEAVRAAQIRHGAHYAGLGSPAAIEALDGDGGRSLRHRLNADLDNLLAACRRAVRRADAAVAVPALVGAWECLVLRGPYETAIRLADVVGELTGMDPGLEARLATTSAEALRHSGRSTEAEGRYLSALEIFRQREDRLGESRALRGLGKLYVDTGRVDSGRSLYEQALGLLRQVGARRWEGVVLNGLGVLYKLQGRLDEARSCLEGALAIHVEGGNLRWEGQALGDLGTLERDQGRPEVALSNHEAALSIHRAVGNRLAEGWALGNLGVLHSDAGRMELARAHYEQALCIYQELGSRRDQSVTLLNLGGLHRRGGRVDLARAHYDESLLICREIGNRKSEGIALGNLALLHESQGRPEVAITHLEQARAIQREIGNRKSEGIALGNLGRILGSTGRVADGQACLEEAIEICDALHPLAGGVFRGDLAVVVAAQGDLDRARQLLHRGEETLRQADRPEVITVLCQRGTIEHDAGATRAAHAALARAQAAADALGTEVAGPLRRALTELRERLA